MENNMPYEIIVKILNLLDDDDVDIIIEIMLALDDEL